MKYKLSTWVFLNFDLTERLFFNCLIFTLSVNLKTKSIFHVKKILLDQYHFALIRACSRDTKIVIDSLVHIIAFLLFPFLVSTEKNKISIVRIWWCAKKVFSAPSRDPIIQKCRIRNHPDRIILYILPLKF